MHTHTQAEMIATVARLQRLAERSRWAGVGRRQTAGRELHLDTEAGRVRVLGYNLDAPERLPLFVDLHGGGFILGHPELDDPFLPGLAAAAGVKILSVDYSLSPAVIFPRALDECHATVAYAQAHPDEFGIDPERIALGGHSAGGNLTAAVCLKNAADHALNLRAAILDYPVLDLYTDAHDKPAGRGLIARTALHPAFSWVFNESYLPDRWGRVDPLVSPVFAQRDQLAGFPPTLILAAGHDSLRAEAELFADHLADAGVDVTYRLFPDSGHGFTLRGRGAAPKEAWRLIAAHLVKAG
jgi:acetyl esterase